MNDGSKNGAFQACIKCSYQVGAHEKENVITIVGSCSYYLDQTYLSPHIEKDHEAFIIQGSTDDPLINIPAPSPIPTALTNQMPCEFLQSKL